MELLREWFLWGESDLFFLGVGILILSMLFPWAQNKNRKNGWIIAGCMVVYGICELVVTFFFQNWLRAYLCLFVGGIALSIALGRIIKAIWKRAFVRKQ